MARLLVSSEGEGQPACGRMGPSGPAGDGGEVASHFHVSIIMTASQLEVSVTVLVVQRSGFDRAADLA